MAIDINIVNNNDLPQAVLVLPEHLQPQPPLVADWCENCLPALAPRRFSAKAVEKALQERDCSRRNIYSNCAKCTEKHRTCVPISPYFRRAFNVLEYVIIINQRRIGRLQADEDDYEEKKAGHLKEIYDLAQDVNQGLIDHRAFIKRETGGDAKREAEWNRARALSQERNYERYKKGLGSVGKCMPTNFASPKLWEQHFTKVNAQGRPEGAENRERRIYYFGPEIPSAGAKETLPRSISDISLR